MTDKFNLYYDRAACSLGVRIALEAAGADYEGTRAFRYPQGRGAKRRLSEGQSPAGRVPTLAIPGEDAALGELLAIHSPILADRFPQAGLPPPGSGLERARALAFMSMLATHVHAAGFGPFFRPERFAAGEAVAGRGQSGEPEDHRRRLSPDRGAARGRRRTSPSAPRPAPRFYHDLCLRPLGLGDVDRGCARTSPHSLRLPGEGRGLAADRGGAGERKTCPPARRDDGTGFERTAAKR